MITSDENIEIAAQIIEHAIGERVRIVGFTITCEFQDFLAVLVAVGDRLREENEYQYMRCRDYTPELQEKI